MDAGLRSIICMISTLLFFFRKYLVGKLARGRGQKRTKYEDG